MTRFLPFGRQGSMSAILRHDIDRQSPGILLHTETEALLDPSLQACIAQLRKLGLDAHVDMARHTGPDGEWAQFRLNARTAAQWAPGSDTTKLCQTLTLDTYGNPRSEEHTSELQSLMRISYAGFCFKKKKPTK